MYHDWPLDELRAYRGQVARPDDFAAFWQDTLAWSRSLAQPVERARLRTPLRSAAVHDLTFSGFGGDPVKAWLITPAAGGPWPAVVEFVGYGGGRGHWLDHLGLASAGLAHLVMDSRGQGASWSFGQTADPHGSGPAVPGVMTRGVTSRETYYYRRLMTDAVLATETVCRLPEIDPERVIVTGASQGGGLALAAAAWADQVAGGFYRVPFLCDIPRALTVTDDYPFHELVDYLHIHRDRADQVMSVLAYFDAVNLARQVTVPGVFTVGLMDTTVPPSGVFAAYNQYSGPKRLQEWPFNGHEGGGPLDDVALLDFCAAQLGLSA
ncbi:MAG: acetylxylan esterase [Propionibacteriaceae bacterium]|jgi:cephalosporin-C deacetylase|nr:acetylxylan esterase [Propionibacteriaceae bacterium]